MTKFLWIRFIHVLLVTLPVLEMFPMLNLNNRGVRWPLTVAHPLRMELSTLFTSLLSDHPNRLSITSFTDFAEP